MAGSATTKKNAAKASKPKTKAADAAKSKGKASAKKAAPPSAAKTEAIAKAKTRAPDVAARIGSTPKTKFRGNADLFGQLVADHDKHRALFAMIAATTGKSPEREPLFVELVHEVSAHAAAEDQALWSSVLRNPETTLDARHAISEHKTMDKMFADLAARDFASPAWIRRFAAAHEEYLHHIKEEEQEQFVAAEKNLTAEDIRYLHGVFKRRKKDEKAAAKVKKKINLKGF